MKSAFEACSVPSREESMHAAKVLIDWAVDNPTGKDSLPRRNAWSSIQHI